MMSVQEEQGTQPLHMADRTSAARGQSQVEHGEVDPMDIDPMDVDHVVQETVAETMDGRADEAYTAYLAWKATPLAATPKVSIVIPAYNEAERIVPTVGAIASYVSTQGYPWELIVADDGSTDETVAILQELDLANMQVLIAEQNGGKGSAVRRGMEAAQGDFILFADADNSTPIEQLGPMLVRMEEEKLDVLVGSRAAEGADEANKSVLRRTMSDSLRWITRNVMHIGVADTQCGFKLFRRDAAKELSRRQTLDGFSFDLELLYLTEKLGYTLSEQPVEWFDAPGSKVDSMKEARRFLQDIARIRMNDMRGVYERE